MDKYARFRYQPCLPLGVDGRKVTGSPEHAELSRRAAGEGMVLLKNEGGTLPLKRGTRVALFGKATVEYIKGGGGSGDVFCAYTRNIYDGFKLKEDEGKVSVFKPTAEFYKEYVKEAGKRIPTRAQIEKIWDRVNAMSFCKEKDDIIYDTFASMHVAEAHMPDELIAEAAANADIAIITLSRFSAEGVDRKAIPDDYYLSDTEKSLIDRVTAAFPNTVIVLNSGAVVDCEYFAENEKVGAIIFGWQGGLEGGTATADIICGDVNPSGRLADTIPVSYDAYQNAQEFLTGFEHLDYFDDIYVGYRYFETVPGAAEKVRYPFGFGLSYTDFEFSGAFCGESDGKIVAAVTVRNVGKVPGKEVVELYYSAPQGKLGKPARELAAFKKTKLLSPGESESLALSFDISDMASFDDLGKIKKSAFVLEKGAYSFHLGASVRATEKLKYEFVLNDDIIIKESKSLCRPTKLEKRLLSDGSFESLPTGEPVRSRGTHAEIEAKAPRRDGEIRRSRRDDNARRIYKAVHRRRAYRLCRRAPESARSLQHRRIRRNEAAQRAAPPDCRRTCGSAPQRFNGRAYHRMAVRNALGLHLEHRAYRRNRRCGRRGAAREQLRRMARTRHEHPPQSPVRAKLRIFLRGSPARR